MVFDEEDYLQLAGIQHFAFCRRQWALIHIEQQWAENVRTIEGNIIHEKAHDDTFTEKRKNTIISRGMPVFSKTMGVRGNCDVVEFVKDKDGVSIFGREGLYLPIPIEYKRGMEKEDIYDQLQLCAQAICLEEMLLCSISFGYLYYAKTKKRVKVELTEELRKSVKEMFNEMHSYYEKRYTPKVKTSVRCRACSLNNICLPKICNVETVKEYIYRTIGGDND